MDVWAINYFVVNYQSTTGNAPIIKQLYFRQVLENLMNQAAVVQGRCAATGLRRWGQCPTLAHRVPVA